MFSTARRFFRRTHIPRTRSRIAGAAALATGCLTTGCGIRFAVAEDPVRINKDHYPKGLNAKFMTSYDDTIGYFAGKGGKLDDPELREIAAEKDRIVRILGNLKSLSIADVGSGTGVLLPLLSKAVGGDGKVYATEISPSFLKFLREKKKSLGLSNVRVMGCSDKSTKLATGSVDLAILCDVYHHVEYPNTFMGDVKRSLKDDGRLVIIDFYNDPSRAVNHKPEWLRDHIRASKEVFRKEIEGAGFKYLCDVVLEELKENYIMVFTKDD